VIGVHAPEFAFEKNIDNVKKAVADLRIGYPVAIDNDYAIWRAFDNHYWPAHYFVDAQGRIRHHHFGVGEYDQSEQIIQQLLAEAGKTALSTGLVSVEAAGAQAASDAGDVHRRRPMSATSARNISYHPAARSRTFVMSMHPANHG
jgi:predicted dehydrogenase